jgi:hypothetical protein
MGINLLPITPASAYLAQLPTDHVERFVVQAEEARKAYDRSGQSDGTTKDIWQDIYASLLALKNPDMALRSWNPRGSVELGETRSHTYFWLHALAQTGPPDTSVWADIMSHAVFRHPSTGKRSYVAFNPSDKAIDVRFSNGVVLRVEPRKVARYSEP